MAHGLILRNSDGVVALDTSKHTWSYLGYFIAPAGQTTLRTFNVISGMTLIAQQHLLNDIPDNQEIVVHTLSISGGTVTASGGTRDSIVTVLGR